MRRMIRNRWRRTASRSGVRNGDATEESKPDSVSGDHLSAGRRTARPPIARGAPYPGLGEQRQWPCLGLQQGGLPFSLPPRSPKRPARAFVSVALAIGYPTPAYAEHLALCCLDFPLTPPKRCKRSPFLRRRNEYTRRHIKRSSLAAPADGAGGPRGPAARRQAERAANRRSLRPTV